MRKFARPSAPSAQTGSYVVMDESGRCRWFFVDGQRMSPEVSGYADRLVADWEVEEYIRQSTWTELDVWPEELQVEEGL